MFLDAPAWPRLFQKVKLDRFTAAARANHRRAPKLGAFSGDVDFRRFEPLWEIVDAYKFDKFRLSPEEARFPRVPGGYSLRD